MKISSLNVDLNTLVYVAKLDTTEKLAYDLEKVI